MGPMLLLLSPQILSRETLVWPGVWKGSSSRKVLRLEVVLESLGLHKKKSHESGH